MPVSQVVVVVSPDHRELIAAALAHHPQVRLAVQEVPRGTADAVLSAAPELADFTGTGVVLLGDALKGADVLAINTEWDVFRHPDFEEVKEDEKK